MFVAASRKRNFPAEEPESSFNTICTSNNAKENPAKKTKIGDKTRTIGSIVDSNYPNSKDSSRQSCTQSASTSTIVAGSSETEIDNLNKITRNLERAKQGSLSPELLNTFYKLAEKFNDPVIRWKQQRDAVNILYPVMKNHLLGMLHDQKAFDILVHVFHRGRAPIKKNILDRLGGNFLEIAKTVNGKRLIEILLKEPTLGKKIIIRDFFGNTIELLKDDIGTHVMETIYANSTSEQKALLISEFYGSEYGNNNSNDDQLVLKLDDIIDQNVFQRNEMTRNILSCLNEKTIKHTIVQDIIIEYLTHAQIRGEDQEITARINQFIRSILHTHKGIHVARLCFYLGTEKDRRTMLKSMKSKFASLCKNQYGHLLIVTIFESVNSIDLVRKMVITEMIRNLQNIMENDYGRVCLVHLLTGRSALLLPQETIKALASMDHIRPRASQKDFKEKMSKLARRMSPTLFRYICQNPAKFFVNHNTGTILCVTLLYANGNRARAVNELIEFIRNTPPQENIMLSPYNRYLSILAYDRFNPSENQSLIAAPPNNSDFAIKLWECIQDHLEFYAINSTSSAVLASLLRIQVVKLQVKIALKRHESAIRRAANKDWTKINWVAQHFGWTKF
ncbi:8082_t:CDS:1 [Ambispora gerdemannii]|uniref:8082_t:CDS:1 n=1 Tax=Ambispora gerdemannii TaxID=144530 RepID=A0A9N8WF87_9GLOM|nr:8082_t:CDS:1 [Ambispora gerdemannii]